MPPSRFQGGFGRSSFLDGELVSAGHVEGLVGTPSQPPSDLLLASRMSMPRGLFFCVFAPHDWGLESHFGFWNQFHPDGGACELRREAPMPGDPEECRKHAKRCWALASEAKNPEVKNSLLEIAQRWTALAADLEATHKLLKAFGDEPDKKTG